MLKRFIKYLKNDCDIKDGANIIIACSGGADSITLLDLFLRARDKHNFNIIAAHVNHKLRGKASDRDEKLVSNFCEENNIEFCSTNWTRPSKGNLENSARNFRKQYLRLLAEKKDAVVAFAHHSDDQAETVLLHIIRGTGAKGLRGMSYISATEKMISIRPLLDFTRSEIEKYCKKRNIKFAIDKTNTNTKFRRNLLRHKVIPLLGKINPKIKDGLLRLSESITTDDIYLEELAKNIPYETKTNSIKWNRKDLKKANRALRLRSLAQGYEYLYGSRKNLLSDHLNRMDIIIHNTGEYSLPRGIKFCTKGKLAYMYK